jgi:hypothetical protein
MCRTPYTAEAMISSAAAKKAASRADAAAKKVAKQTRTITERAPKIEALFQALYEMKDDEKGVIFSQWYVDYWTYRCIHVVPSFPLCVSHDQTHKFHRLKDELLGHYSRRTS